jgi:2-polyprenyl-6-methoxyphenol hydroxylase-like FAD-dependent oxidoreductase
MRTVIAGGGIGGLAAALSLHAAGLRDLQVLEAVPELQPIGVGVNLPPHAVRELTELGLGEDLARIGIPTLELAYYDPAGTLIWTEPRGTPAGYRWPQYSIHRGELQMLLLGAVRERMGREAVRTDCRLTGLRSTEDGGIEALTATGPAVRGDVLVGADGIRSAVRALLYPQEGPLPWNGWFMFRGRTWAPPYLTGGSMVIIGDEVQRVVAYPIGHARGDGQVLTNWILTRRVPGEALARGDWNRSADPAEVARHIEGWRYDWLDAHALVADAELAYEYPMVDLDPLPRWSHGRVTLLGDAAHAMYPFGSNGASQAILDARVLAQELATRPDPLAALAAYDARRRETVAKVQLANREQAGGVMARVSALARRSAHGSAADELMAVETEYKRLAGFDAETLNTRASLSVARAH